MIEILFAVIIIALGFAIVLFAEQRRSQTVPVSCHCGAKRCDLICIDAADARRYAATLSEDCPRCRALRPRPRSSKVLCHVR